MSMPSKIQKSQSKIFKRTHINSFPKIKSHYCRSTTKKEYLDRSLDIQKMEIYMHRKSEGFNVSINFC